MTASTRFIALALFSWAGVRAVSLGLVPGSEALAFDRPPPPGTTALLPVAGLPPVEPTEFAPIEPVTPPGAVQEEMADVSYPPSAAVPARYAYREVWDAPPAYTRAARSAGRSSAHVRLAEAEAMLPEPRALPFTTDLLPSREVTPLERMASALLPEGRGRPLAAGGGEVIPPPPLAGPRKRFEMSSWAMLRGKPGDLLGPNSLAANGATLGGSQAGARVNYWVTQRLAASLRASTPLGGARGGEIAAGVRYQPFRRVPVSITAERRQRFGRAGGRNDFALFVEGGLWDQPLPAGFRLDGYAQAGVVGVSSRDLFGDGAFTITRPLWKRVSGGFGVWGGAQPNLYRLDAGPRLSIAMGRSMRVHLDYRQRLAGTASPSSGPAITIAGDF